MDPQALTQPPSSLRGQQMKKKLTKRTVDALTPRDSRYDVFDTELAGFHVRVTPNGEKTFYVRYRAGFDRNAPRPRLRLDRYGVLTVDEARALAKKHLADVVRGEDPAAVRAAKRTAETVGSFGQEYLRHVDAHRQPSTAKEYRRLWNKHIEPELGRKAVASVTAKSIADLHISLKQTPTLANRVLALLGAFFSMAEKHKVIPKGSNPAHEVSPFKESPRETFLNPEQVARLGQSLHRAETDGVPPSTSYRQKSRGVSAARKARMTGRTRGPYKRKAPAQARPANPYAIAAIRFLLLTAFRKEEALTLQWAFLSPDLSKATLPRSKTGRSIRPIGKAARELLSTLPRVDGSPYVFPGTDPSTPLRDINRVWFAVREHAGLQDVRLHDLRHSFASAAASGRSSIPILSKILGHTQIKTTDRYVHLFDDPVQEAADDASTQLAGWLNQHTGGSAAAATPRVDITASELTPRTEVQLVRMRRLA